MSSQIDILNEIKTMIKEVSTIEDRLEDYSDQLKTIKVTREDKEKIYSELGPIPSAPLFSFGKPERKKKIALADEYWRRFEQRKAQFLITKKNSIETKIANLKLDLIEHNSKIENNGYLDSEHRTIKKIDRILWVLESKKVNTIIEAITLADMYDEGYDEGYDNGYSDGYDAGYSSGADSAYDEGWNDAVDRVAKYIDSESF